MDVAPGQVRNLATKGSRTLSFRAVAEHLMTEVKEITRHRDRASSGVIQERLRGDAGERVVRAFHDRSSEIARSVRARVVLPEDLEVVRTLDLQEHLLLSHTMVLEIPQIAEFFVALPSRDVVFGEVVGIYLDERFGLSAFDPRSSRALL